MTFTIRDATTGDAESIQACLSAAFEPFRQDYTPAAFVDTVPDTDGVRARLLEMTVVVAVNHDGVVVGTIGFECSADGDAHVRGMAVHPARQGEGLARQLLDVVERRVLERGCGRLALDTTAPLTRAIAFYLRADSSRPAASSASRACRCSST